LGKVKYYTIKILVRMLLHKIYEKMLERRIERVPNHIVVICDEVNDKFEMFINWCKKFGIKEVTLCISSSPKLDINGIKIKYIDDSKVVETGHGEFLLNVIANYSGKDEIIGAIKKLAYMVTNGKIEPDKLKEEDIEKMLTIKSQPDMIIKAGNEIPEFLIWQSIYSEIYFIDIDWKTFRYVDFLRMLREYQRRERRYGR